MAVIRCPECQQPMSSTLKACPHCGYVLSNEEKIKALEEVVDNPVNFKQSNKQTLVGALKSNGVVKIDSNRAQKGEIKIEGGVAYYKDTGFNWALFIIGFLFLTILGAIILGACVPNNWEKLFSISEIGKIEKQERDFGNGPQRAIVVTTKSGKVVCLAPELFEQWETYLDSLSFSELTDEEVEDFKNKANSKKAEMTKGESAAAVIVTLVTLTVLVIVIVVVALAVTGNLY